MTVGQMTQRQKTFVMREKFEREWREVFDDFFVDWSEPVFNLTEKKFKIVRKFGWSVATIKPQIKGIFTRRHDNQNNDVWNNDSWINDR